MKVGAVWILAMLNDGEVNVLDGSSLFHKIMPRMGGYGNIALRLGLVLLVSLVSFDLRKPILAAASAKVSSLAPSPRLLVKMRDVPAGSQGSSGLDASSLSQLDISSTEPLFDAGSGDADLKRTLGLSRIYALTLSPTGDPQQALATLSADPAVEYAELDLVGYGAGVPDDAYFAHQWGLHNTGQSGGQPDADIDAPEAWEITTGVTSTVLAIIDTGADLDHPDLAAKIVPGYDFVNDDAQPWDDHGHGTHVAGVAAAATGNATGIAGVCPDCRIMPLKGLNDENWGYYSWWASAIEYAVDHGADVINMSMGGVDSSQVLYDAVLYAYGADVPIVAAMMNDGDSTSYYPAVYTQTIAVGATNRLDERWASSNFGDHIDVVAPGVAIWSTLWDDAYASWEGTSMAAPHVTGVLGLIESVRPDYTVEELRAVLAASADDQVGPPNEDKKGWDQYFGAGRLNAARAVQEVSFPTFTVCPGGGCDFDAIQDAVDAASDGTTIKIAAGTYSTLNDHGGLAQVVYVEKSVIIRGGYTSDFAAPPDPTANPTVVDPQGGGRGIYVMGDITPTIAGLQITGGDATGLNGDVGGGIYIVEAHATISDTRVFSNTARWGGGLYLEESDAVLVGNVFVTNAAEWGGGLYVAEQSPARLIGNTVAANEASYDGGGLYLRESDAVLFGDVFVDNTAGQSGGGLYLYQSDAGIEGATVTANEAAEGGGLYLWMSDATVDRITVMANHAGTGGGLLLAHSDAFLSNAIIADNWTDGAGGGLYVEDSAPRLLHATVARNTPAADGICVAGSSTVALTNTILVGHTMGITVGTASVAALEATLWGAEGWANGVDWGGAGTFLSVGDSWGDPAFVDPATGDYHIGPTSAAADAGVAAGIVVDIDDEQRPQGGGYDIGADEADPRPDLTVTQYVSSNPLQAGAQLTYTIYVANTGGVSLTLRITDTLPAHVTPGGARVWTPAALPPGGVWEEKVVVAVDLVYNGLLTNTVRVTSDEGAVGLNAGVAVVADEVITVSPSRAASIVVPGQAGSSVRIDIPAGAVTQTTQFAYTSAFTEADAPAGYVFAGHAFGLDAYRAGEPCSGLVFEVPVTFVIQYTDVGIEGLDENTLELRFWDGEGWSLDGITLVERDVLDNELFVRSDHLSEFALFAREMGGHDVYLPLVVKR
jgi:thermitase